MYDIWAKNSKAEYFKKNSLVIKVISDKKIVYAWLRTLQNKEFSSIAKNFIFIFKTRYKWKIKILSKFAKIKGFSI